MRPRLLTRASASSAPGAARGSRPPRRAAGAGAGSGSGSGASGSGAAGSAAAPAPSTRGPPALPSTSAPASTRRVVPLKEYRRNVGVCLVNQDGLVFAARRTDCTQGSWQMPQGGIDHLENPLAAAARELREETGIVSARTVAIGATWTAYDHPTVVPLAESRAACSSCGGGGGAGGAPSSPGAGLLLTRAGIWTPPGAPSPPPPPPPPPLSAAEKNNILPTHVQYRGQTQKWVLMRFYGPESEICLGDPAHPDTAFSDYAWMALDDLVAGAVPFKRDVYAAVAAEFGPLIAAWAGRADADWWARG